MLMVIPKSIQSPMVNVENQKEHPHLLQLPPVLRASAVVAIQVMYLQTVVLHLDITD